ncbi:hypothetical protein DER44DRAFT_802802 [Fusarium oxysporum]|nr:hypothetical protein DER44DRAFT_802802 [Fusarium oxysporum]
MSTCINGERRTPFPPSGTCPTRSQPYGSFKHIVLDVEAERRITFKRASRQRELFLSSLEFSCTDRSSSFPYPEAGSP